MLVRDRTSDTGKDARICAKMPRSCRRCHTARHRTWLRPVACGQFAISWHASDTVCTCSTSSGQVLVKPIVHVYVIVTLITDHSAAELEQWQSIYAQLG